MYVSGSGVAAATYKSCLFLPFQLNSSFPASPFSSSPISIIHHFSPINSIHPSIIHPSSGQLALYILLLLSTHTCHSPRAYCVLVLTHSHARPDASEHARPPPRAHAWPLVGRTISFLSVSLTGLISNLLVFFVPPSRNSHHGYVFVFLHLIYPVLCSPLPSICPLATTLPGALIQPPIPLYCYCTLPHQPWPLTVVRCWLWIVRFVRVLPTTSIPY
jgi:hypothetical protein